MHPPGPRDTAVEARPARVAVFTYPNDLIEDCFDVRGGPLQQVGGSYLASASGADAVAKGYGTVERGCLDVFS